MFFRDRKLGSLPEKEERRREQIQWCIRAVRSRVKDSEEEFSRSPTWIKLENWTGVFGGVVALNAALFINTLIKEGDWDKEWKQLCSKEEQEWVEQEFGDGIDAYVKRYIERQNSK